MQIDITKLKSGYESSIVFERDCTFSKDVLKGTDLLDLKNVQVKGTIDVQYDTYHIEATVSGIMVLPCSITLEEVNYPFSVIIDEDLDEQWETRQKKYRNYENSIDILPIIWENILMEIPMKVVSENAKNIHLEGNGWRLIADGDTKSNSPFDKLNDLIK